MQAYVIAREVGPGSPEVHPSLSPPDADKVVGGVLCHFVSVGQWGFYTITGKVADIASWVADPTVYFICYRTRDGELDWSEAEDAIEPAVRTRLNSWLTAHGYPNIPVGWGKRRVVQEFVDRLIKGRWPNFSLDVDRHFDPDVD